MINRKFAIASGKKLFSSRLFSGGMWMLFGRITTLLLGLVVGGLLARILSPENMGVFVFIESLVLTAAMFAQLGLGHTSVRLIARAVARNNFTATKKILLYVFQWGLLGSIISAVTLFLIGPHIGIPTELLVWASVWVLIYAAQQLLADIFRGFQDFRGVVLIGGSKVGGVITSGIAALLLFVIWQVYGRLDLQSVFPILLIGGVPTLLFALVSLLKKKPLREKSAENEKNLEPLISRKEILWAAFPVLVTTLTTTLLNKSGIWVITAFRTSSEVALFGLVVRLVAIISIPMNFFETLISPTIVDLYTRGAVKRLETLLRSATTLLSLFSIVVLAVFVLFGADILGFVYGDFYRSGATILTLLVLGSVASVVTGPCGMTLVMTGNQKTLMKIDVVSSIASVVLMLALVNPLGVTGVAVALVLSTIAKNIMMLVATKRRTGIWTHATLKLDKRMVSELLK